MARINRRKSRKRKRRGSRCASFFRAVVLEGTGALVLLALFFLVRFDPDERPRWLFGSQQAETNQLDNPRDRFENNRVQTPLAAGISSLIQNATFRNTTVATSMGVRTGYNPAVQTSTNNLQSVNSPVSNNNSSESSQSAYRQTSYYQAREAPVTQLQDVWR